jgi:putative membrane protein
LIIRDRPSGWRLFFVLRGSIVPKVAPQILAVMILSVAVDYFHDVLSHRSLIFTAVPFTIIGLALSIFLGLRV